MGLLFFVSGVAALVLETTWIRWFRLLFGATAPAVSATLVAFFLGHALGAAWAARASRRWTRPLRVYGGLELCGAAWALTVPLVLGLAEQVTAAAYDALGTSSAGLTAVRFAIALLATLPTAICFGATLPAIGSAALAEARGIGRTGTALYATNTLGGACGVVLAVFLLPDWLGVEASYAVGWGALAGVGGAALWLRGPERGEPIEPSTGPIETGLNPRRLLVLAALSGFGALAGQVLLVQGFGQVLNQSTYAYGAVLVTVLAALAAGAFLVSLLLSKTKLDARALLATAFSAAALLFAAFPALLVWASDGLQVIGSARPWPTYLVEALGFTMALSGPALFAAGLALPLTFALAGSRAGAAPAGATLGRIAAANTVGAIAGALAAPYLLVPFADLFQRGPFSVGAVSGLWLAFGLLGGIYAVAALLVPQPSPRARWRRDLLLGLGFMLVLARGSPTALPPVRFEPGDTLLSARATAAGVVAVLQREGERLIRTDNHYVLGGSAERVHEERQGHLPLLLHPDARSAVFVGTATGISAGAGLAHPLERLHLVELVPRVADAARRFFGDYNRGVYEDPRSVVVVDDARNFLRLTRERFDLVVADLFVPWRSGASSLYTVEHFKAVRSRLNQPGLFCQWLALYQLSEIEFRIVLASFLDVFPRSALFRGDFYGRFPIVALCGWRGDPIPAVRVSAATERLAERGETDRWLIDPVGFWSLYVGPVSPGPGPEDLPRNLDDRPRIEFLAGRSHRGAAGKEDPFVGVAWAGFAESVRQAALLEGDAFYPDLDEAQRRAALGGSALQLAGGLYVTGREAEAARAFTTASESLPARLVAEAPADDTAAELWWE